MKKFELDIHSDTVPVDRYWEMMVGSCHAATALRQDYRQQLEQCQRELGFRYVRFHGLFDDDMSVVKKPFYGLLGDKLDLSFTNIDNIFDWLLSVNMKPFIELGFMPEALASGDQTVFHYKGNTTPPADHEKWRWFIGQFVQHLIARYGRDEVRQWFFEVWNEPNLGAESGLQGVGFWSGTMQDYYELYKYTALAIKEVDPSLPVGGPATSNNAHITDFIRYCKDNDVPVDFISTHHYPTDVVLGYGVEDSHNFVERLMDIDRKDKVKLMKLAAEYMVFQKHLWDKVDRGVLTDMARRAAAEADGLPLYYTEWSSLAGLDTDGPFGASFIAKTILDNMGLVQGYAYWTFSDIFEESGMPSAAFHGGFGLLTLQGVPKAPYRVFQLLHQLGDARYIHEMSDGTIDVYALRKQESNALQLLCVNHHSLNHKISAEKLSVALNGLGDAKQLDYDVLRIDDDHANALAKWQQLGKPEYVTAAQVDAMKAASALEREDGILKVSGGKGDLKLELAPMATALVTLYL